MPLIEAPAFGASEACGRTVCGAAAETRLTGTCYLIAPDRVVTAAQVIPHLARDPEGLPIEVDIAGHAQRATLLSIDDRMDVAVLRLPQPIHEVEPFALALPSVGPCAFRFANAAPGQANTGILLDVDVRNTRGDPRMTLQAPGLAEQMLPAGHPFAGAPVVVEGQVVGHLTNPARDPNSMGESFVDLVQAAPAGSVAEVLGLPPLEGRPSDRPPLFVPPEIGRKENHAYVSYRAIEDRSGNDEDFAKAVADQLGDVGFRCYLAPHFLFGNNPLKSEYEKELGRSRVGLLLFSRKWSKEPAFPGNIASLRARAADADDPFKAVVVRLDDTELPEELASFPSIDVHDDRLELDKRRPPTFRAIREIAEAIGAQTTREGDIAGTRVTRGETASETLKAVEDRVLTELTRLRRFGKKNNTPNPRTIRAVGERWLDLGLAGSEVPVEAARLMIGWLEYADALELLDRAEHALGAAAGDRDKHRLRRMRGICLSELGETDDAIELLESVAREGPLDAWAGGILAGIYKRKWIRLGRHRPLLLRKAFRIYRDTYGRTLHYYPGINAATLAKMLGDTGASAAIASQIRTELEGHDDLYHWDEATLGEAYLLLGEYDLALKAYSNAALQVVTDRKAMVSMRRQFPLILGDDPEDARALEMRAELDELFSIGHVAAFSGHLDPSLADDPNDYQVRKLRNDLDDALDREDVAFGFCAGGDDLSDLIFAQCVLARSGRVKIVLPYLRTAFESEISTPVRALFDEVTSHERVEVTELNAFVPRDRARARQECSRAVLDLALEEARLLEEEPIFILAVDETVPPPAPGNRNDTPTPRLIEAVAVDEAKQAGNMASADGLRKIEISPRLPDDVEQPPRRRVASETPGSEAQELGENGESRSTDPSRGTRRRNSAEPIHRGPGEYDNRHLMVVGIDAYSGGWQPLQNARNDAKEFKELMVREFGFDVRTALFDEQADKASIEEAFREDLNRSGKVKENDLVVFFFAGHGHTERRLNDEEQGYLVPYGVPEGRVVGLLSFEELQDWTKDLPAKHALFILDSCFSGIAATGGGGAKPKPGYARIVITAGSMEQLVFDGGPFPGHSIFTGRLLHGLKNESELARPIYDGDLVSYLQKSLLEDTKHAPRPQHPGSGTLPRHAGGPIVLTEVPRSRDSEPSEA